MGSLKTQSIEKSLPGVGKDVIKYAPSKIFGMLMNLFLVPIYTNLLSPDQYGLYGISIGFLSFIAIVFSDWVGLSGLRFFQEHFNAKNTKSYFSTLLFLISSNLLLMYLFVFVFYEKLSEFFKIPGSFIVLVVLLLIPVSFRALMFQIIRAQIRPLTYTIIVLVNQITTIAIAYYLIKYLGLGAEGILIGMALSIGIIDIVMLFISGLARNSSVKLVNKDNLVSFYRYGLPLALSSLGMWGITQSNKFVLQHYKGSFYNGLAGVGYNLTYSLLFPLFAIITLAAIPRIIKEFESGNEVKAVISKLSGYYILIFAPIVLLIAIYPYELVMLMSNEKYISSQIIIPFLAVSAFIYGLTEYTVIQYHLVKKTYIHTIIKLSPAIFGILLGIALIPHYKDENVLFALGLASVISQIIYLALTLLIKMKDLEWAPPYEIIKRTVFGLLVGMLILTAIRFLNFNELFNNTLIQILIFLVTYLSVIFYKFK